MKKKNKMDDGSYQKSRKLDTRKGYFNNNKPQMSEWEESKVNPKTSKPEKKIYRLPLDAEGKPAAGFVPEDISDGGFRTSGHSFYRGRGEEKDIEVLENKRRDNTDDISYDPKSRKFKDTKGNIVNDPDIYYEDKLRIMSRDSRKSAKDFEDFKDRAIGKVDLSPWDISNRIGYRNPKTRDIEGEGIEKPSKGESIEKPSKGEGIDKPSKKDEPKQKKNIRD